MDLYSSTAAMLSRLLTRRYSTSFSSASRLFPSDIQHDIYNIYGLVRVADEIVDTYHGTDQPELLDEFEREVYAAIERGFSTNPIIQAFADTARQHGIGKVIIRPFFDSMRMDLTPRKYDRKSYAKYIYGSAEVVGLMCLKVFCAGDTASYKQLLSGARKLGSAYQKVNFLRDLAADQRELGRFYFPGMTFDTFSEQDKSAVIQDIRSDFHDALPYIHALPRRVRPAVMTSCRYYSALLTKLQHTPAEQIKRSRIRLPTHQKALLLATQAIRVRR